MKIKKVEEYQITLHGEEIKSFKEILTALNEPKIGFIKLIDLKSDAQELIKNIIKEFE